MPRKKLYELAKFDDPALERCRQNAINAKRNRDRRQREKEALWSQMNALRESNHQLKNDSVRLAATANLFEQRYAALADAVRRHGLAHLLSEEAGQMSEEASQMSEEAGQMSEEASQMNKEAGPLPAGCGRRHKTVQARNACSACKSADK
jgi:hypothetical protein